MPRIASITTVPRFWWAAQPESCIMENRNGTCKALTIDCPGALDCKFYKDEEMQEQSMKKWSNRMRTLPYQKQKHYAERHYGKRFIWEKY